MDHWKWPYYNFSAGSFTQRNFVADFIRLKFTFITQNEKMLFEPPFLELGVTYALHLWFIGKHVSTSYFS